MKKWLFIFFFGATASLQAQEKQLAKDEDGKFIFYQVVDTSAVAKQILIEKAKTFLTTLNKKHLKLSKVTDSALTADGKMILERTVLTVGHPSGEVSYTLTFEAKDNKYRFWLKNFLFTPYQRDRYGNFVAATTVGTPLEQKVSKLSQSNWRDIQNATFAKAAKFGADFRKYMASIEAEAKKTASPPNQISTKKW